MEIIEEIAYYLSPSDAMAITCQQSLDLISKIF